MKKILKELIPYVIIVIVVILFRTFIATPIRVDGPSMEDTLKNGDILFLNKLDKSYKRFDIVVIYKNNVRLIKRVIGLPGENIEYKDNTLYINGKEIEDVALIRTANFTLKDLYGIDRIPKGYYFVMGDNRTVSKDSRYDDIGLIKKSEIAGTTSFRIFPFNKIGKIK